MDHSNQPGLLETFAAFQTKLTALQEAASRVIALQQRQAEETESSVGTPADASSAMAAGATAAAKEQCRTLVLATQELAKNLTKPEQKRMANSFAEQAEACVSTSGALLSMLAPDSWGQMLRGFFLRRCSAQHEGTRHEGQWHGSCAPPGHLPVVAGP